MADWKNRIVSYGVKPADQFTAHPDNPKFHPAFQRSVIRDLLGDIGWVDDVMVSLRSGYVLDGHERIWTALERGDSEPVPFHVVDVSEEEEAKILATFDPSGWLAKHDTQKLDALLRDVNTDSPALQQMLAELAAPYQMSTDNDWQAALGGLADGDRAPFQQMTFTLHDEQAEQVKAAIDLAKSQGAFVDSPNENSNGNALARICETYLTLVSEDG